MSSKERKERRGEREEDIIIPISKQTLKVNTRCVYYTSLTTLFTLLLTVFYIRNRHSDKSEVYMIRKT